MKNRSPKIHRDIRPENIIINMPPTHGVWEIDFGSNDSNPESEKLQQFNSIISSLQKLQDPAITTQEKIDILEQVIASWDKNSFENDPVLAEKLDDEAIKMLAAVIFDVLTTTLLNISKHTSKDKQPELPDKASLLSGLKLGPFFAPKKAWPKLEIEPMKPACLP